MRYNKLVRDRVPAIIEKEGRKAVTRTASEEEFLQKLGGKMLEEAEEFLQTGETEELADVLEAIYAICNLRKISLGQLEEIRKRKAAERGGFSKRVLLEETK
jgi:predicted house-cleaning noncanonical NTP pyrophosphatase (MazG superfamily)